MHPLSESKGNKGVKEGAISCASSPWRISAPVNSRQIKVTNKDDLLVYTKVRDKTQNRVINLWSIRGRSVHEETVYIKRSKVDGKGIGKGFSQRVGHDALTNIKAHSVLSFGFWGVMAEKNIVRNSNK